MKEVKLSGLFDKNHIEIKEGDFVKAYIPSSSVIPTETISQVSFSEGSFTFLLSNNEPLTLRDAINISNSKECCFKGVEIISKPQN
jgi:hypothetical protein